MVEKAGQLLHLRMFVFSSMGLTTYTFLLRNKLIVMYMVKLAM